MGLFDHIRVLSQPGTSGSTNSDAYLYAQNSDVDLYMVFDGCSSSTNSAELCNEVAGYIKNAFIGLSANEVYAINLRHSMERIFSQARQDIAVNFKMASLSFSALLVIDDKVGMCFHLGDAAVGYIGIHKQLKWITLPHTILKRPINDIKDNSYRNYLKKTFKYQNENIADWKVFPFNGSDVFILATDGWWATDGKMAGHDDMTKIEVRRRRPT